MFSQGIRLITAPPPIRVPLFAFDPMPGISAIPLAGPDVDEDGGESLAAAGGEELDPIEGGTKGVVSDFAEEDEPAPSDVLFDPADELEPKDVLFEPADDPPRAVLFDPADEPPLGDESESGKGGTAAAGDEELESGVAGAGELDSAAGLDEVASGAGLAESAPGRRLLMLLGNNPLSFSISEEKKEVTVDAKPPLALPAPEPVVSVDRGEASLERVSGWGADLARPFACFPLFIEPSSDVGAASTIVASSFPGMAGDKAALPVAFDAPVPFDAGPPDVSGKGDKLNGLPPDELPDSVPSSPGNALSELLPPLEEEADDGGEGKDDSSELSPPTSGAIDSASLPLSRPGKAARINVSVVQPESIN